MTEFWILPNILTSRHQDCGQTKNYSIEPGDPVSPGLPTLFLGGANALVDRNKLMILGGFDEPWRLSIMRMWKLSLRAWRLGWNAGMNPGLSADTRFHPQSPGFINSGGSGSIAAANRLLYPLSAISGSGKKFTGRSSPYSGHSSVGLFWILIFINSGPVFEKKPPV